MSKCENFLNFFNELLEQTKIEMPDDVKEFYDMLKTNDSPKENKQITDIGLQILEFLQQSEQTSFKSKDIAEGMEMSSKRVSGAMGKLVRTGYVEKFGEKPIVYSLTDYGKNFDIETYKKGEQN